MQVRCTYFAIIFSSGGTAAIWSLSSKNRLLEAHQDKLMLLRLSLHFSLKLRSYRRFHYLWKNAKGGIWTHNPLWKCFTTCAKIVFSPFIPLKRHELFIQVVNPISFFSQMKLFSNFHFNAIPLFRLFSQMKIYWAFKFLKWNKNMIKKHSL